VLTGSVFVSHRVARRDVSLTELSEATEFLIRIRDTRIQIKLQSRNCGIYAPLGAERLA